MSYHILVAFASKSGATAEVATAIGAALVAPDVAVDVLPVGAVPSLEPYDAVIVGSCIRAGHWLREAAEFVARYQDTLEQKPVAYFTVCMTMAAESADARRETESYMEPMRALVKPVSMGMFAGRCTAESIGWLEWLAATIMQVPKGDRRNWDQIHDWALHVLPLLLPQRAPQPEPVA